MPNSRGATMDAYCGPNRARVHAQNVGGTNCHPGSGGPESQDWRGDLRQLGNHGSISRQNLQAPPLQLPINPSSRLSSEADMPNNDPPRDYSDLSPALIEVVPALQAALTEKRVRQQLQAVESEHPAN